MRIKQIGQMKDLGGEPGRKITTQPNPAGKYDKNKKMAKKSNKNSNPDLRQKIERAITALSDLADILPKGDDQNRIVEQIEALNVEYQAQPISHPALRKICLEVSKLLRASEL